MRPLLRRMRRCRLIAGLLISSASASSPARRGFPRLHLAHIARPVAVVELVVHDRPAVAFDLEADLEAVGLAEPVDHARGVAVENRRGDAWPTRRGALHGFAPVNS